MVWRLTGRAAARFAEPVAALGIGEAREVRLQTEDGLTLGAWFVPGEGGCLLLLHGNGSSRSAFIEVMRKLRGRCLLAVTLRAHGDSDGERNDLGYGARLDVQAAVAWLAREQPRSRRIVYGSSLGAAAAIHAASGLAVDGFILESPYRDLETALTARLGQRLPRPAAWLAALSMRPWAPLLLGVSLSRLSPREAAAGILAPAVFLAGERDWRAPPSQVREIAARVKDARVEVFPGADHGQLRASDPSRWFALLQQQ